MIYILSCETVENGGGIYAFDFTENGGVATRGYFLCDRPMYAVSAGVGLKLYVPGMGPLSIDYGIPLTNPGSNGSEHGYFTFGVGDMMY